MASGVRDDTTRSGAQPTEATRLQELSLLSLDTETTGMDLRHDRIVSIGMVRVEGLNILRSTAFETLIRSDRLIPPAASAIHHITDVMVRDAPGLAEVWPELQSRAAGAVLLGHHIGFDMAMLAAAEKRHGLSWPSLLSLDTARLASALDPSEKSVALEDVARRHGIDPVGRHTALGDSLIAAELYLKMLPRLFQRGIVTLGDAIRFGATARIVADESAAGWGEARMLGDHPALQRLDAFPYLHRIGDVMSQPLRTIEPHRSLADAARLMAEVGVSALVTLGPAGEPAGIVTERDLVRAISRGGDAIGTAVSSLASSPVATVNTQDRVHVGVGRLDRLGYRHLVVVDNARRAVGMVTARSLLRQRAATALLIGDEIESATEASELAAAKYRLPFLAKSLRSEGIPSLDVAAVLSAVLCDMTRKAAAMAESEMAGGSWGAAPASWAMLVLGSGGRGESLLGPDQDNALVHLGSAADDAWYAELGRRVADTLDRAGVPYCRGGVMAREPKWRHSLSGWRTTVRHWAAGASPQDVLTADIFFDSRGVAGDHALAEELRAAALAEVGGSPMLLQHLSLDLARTRAPVGFFGAIRSTDGRIDLKLHGLLPIVGAARVLGLRHGVPATGTSARLQALSDAGHLSEADLDRLRDAHALLMTLILDQQIADVGSGVPPTGNVQITSLGRSKRNALKGALRYIEEFARQVAGGFG